MESIDPALADLLETFLVDSPMEFASGHAQPLSGKNSPILGTFRPNIGHPLSRPALHLHAESSTNMLALGATEWNSPHPDLHQIDPNVAQALPMRISGASGITEDSTWGASFDLDGYSPNLAGSEHLHSMPQDTASQLSPSPEFKWLQNHKLFGDPTQVTSPDTADALDWGVNDSDREEKVSEEGRQNSQGREFRSSSLKLERKSGDTAQLDHRRSRKREKDRIEELQTDIQKLTDCIQNLGTSIQTLTGQLKDKEEILKQARGVDETNLPSQEDDRMNATMNTPLRLSVFGESGTQSREFSAEQVRSMTEEDLRGLWSIYAAQMRNLVRSSDHSSGSHSAMPGRLALLQQEAVILHIRTALTNPGTLKSLLVNSGRAAHHSAVQNMDFWQHIAASMNLSGTQQACIVQFWAKYLDQTQRLLDVRKSITKHISSTMPDGLFGRSFAINFLKAHELMDALKYNLRQEHNALNDLTAKLYKLLSPLQFAILIVHCWPSWPDIPQIVKCCI